MPALIPMSGPGVRAWASASADAPRGPAARLTSVVSPVATSRTKTSERPSVPASAALKASVGPSARTA